MQVLFICLVIIEITYIDTVANDIYIIAVHINLCMLIPFCFFINPNDRRRGFNKGFTDLFKVLLIFTNQQVETDLFMIRMIMQENRIYIYFFVHKRWLCHSIHEKSQPCD